MSIKCILVPLSGTPTDAAVSKASIIIAKNFGSEIQAVFGRRSAAMEASLMIGGIDDAVTPKIYEMMRAESEKSEIAAREAFREILEKVSSENSDGTMTALLEITDTSEIDAVIERGGAYDLLVIAKPEAEAQGQAQAQDVAEAALFHTGRQVLLAPADVRETIGERILIAWNRSAQAGRAVSQALPFLERAKEVLIFYVETGAKRGPSPGRLKHYLGLHGVDANVVEIPPDYRSVGEQILDQANEFEADLIVMGAYSKSRLRERLLGGVTQYAFSKADLPVLMTR